MAAGQDNGYLTDFDKNHRIFPVKTYNRDREMRLNINQNLNYLIIWRKK